MSARELEDVAALPGDLAALDDVRGVAHQRVGERRLAGAVRAHDRVDLARPDLEVDALQDLVLRAGDGRDAEAADDKALVGGQGSSGVARGSRGSVTMRSAPSEGGR